MSSYLHKFSSRVAVIRLALVTLLFSVGIIAVAQDEPAPKWEIFGGYSFFDPGGNVHGMLPGGLLPVESRLESNPRGIGASVTYDFTRWFGLTADASGQFGSNESGVAARIDDASLFNISVGPKLTLRRRHFSPFIEALVGGHRLKSDLFQADDRFGFMAGGGLDVNVKRHFALRVIRGDYVFSNHQYGPESTVAETEIRGVRLQSGVVFMFGGGTTVAAPLTAACSVQPTEVLVGEPVTASATGNNFNPKHTLNYTWSSTGGQITGKDATANVDTNGVAAGSYTITAHIADPRMKNGGDATCTSTFAVKEPIRTPPVVSCLSNPSTVQTGSPSTITCTCTSPDNIPVTVDNWSASGGSVSGSGNTGTLNTSGAAAGQITVNANCKDSRGLATQGSTQITVEAPVVSPEFQQLEARLVLHSIYFATARPTAKNPDGGLLASQQQTLVSLAEDFKKYMETKPDAHLTLEGHADPRGSVEYNQALSERRVERAKRFLIEHGVPEANIETKAFGEGQNQTEAQVRDGIEHNPELTSEQRQRVLDNLPAILLASNRRVDITLSTTGQQSIRQYPFNAADSLTLIRQAAPSKTGKDTVKK